MPDVGGVLYNSGISTGVCWEGTVELDYVSVMTRGCDIITKIGLLKIVFIHIS